MQETQVGGPAVWLGSVNGGCEVPPPFHGNPLNPKLKAPLWESSEYRAEWGSQVGNAAQHQNFQLRPWP